MISQNITLLCTVAPAEPEPEVEWAWQGHLIRDGSLGMVGSSVFKLTTWSNKRFKMSNLTILNAGVDHSGHYSCTALNKAGQATATISLHSLAKSIISVSNSEIHKQQKALVIPSEDIRKQPQGIKRLGVIIAMICGTVAAFGAIATACFIVICSRPRRNNRSSQNSKSNSPGDVQGLIASSDSIEIKLESMSSTSSLKRTSKNQDLKVRFDVDSERDGSFTTEDQGQKEDIEDLSKQPFNRWSFPKSMECPTSPNSSKTEIDDFIREYQELQEQLLRVKLACDNLRKAKIEEDIKDLKLVILKSAGILDEDEDNKLLKGILSKN